jgi:large subunit ribosomal protein L10
MRSPEKVSYVEKLQQLVTKAPYVILVNYAGLTVDQFSELRKRLGDAGAKVNVTRNAYLRKTLSKFPEMEAELIGQTAVVSGDKDLAAMAKVIKNFHAEFDKPTFKVGIVDGAVMNKTDLQKIASLPSREALLTQLVILINTPGSQIARAIKAKVDKENEAKPAAPAKKEEAKAPAATEAPKAEEKPVEAAAPAPEAKTEGEAPQA